MTQSDPISAAYASRGNLGGVRAGSRAGRRRPDAES